MEGFYEYYNPTRIIFSQEGLRELGKYIVKHVGGNLALVLLDKKTFLGCKELVDELLDSLRTSGLEYVVFDDLPLNPSLGDIERVIDVFRRSYADLLLGFGNWNAVTTAKNVAAAISLGGSPTRIITGYERIGSTIPVVIVPSAHGNGLEVSGYTMLESRGRIHFIYSQALYPKLAVYDPRITLKTPLNIAVLSVVEALANALSALVSANSNPMSNLYARAALETVLSNHKLLLEKPDNIGVRGELLWASMLAGKAFDLTGPSLVHVLAHTIAFMYGDLYPGRVTASLLPSWIQYVLPRATNKNLLARILKVNIEEIPRRIVEILEEMKAYTRLSDLGITGDEIIRVLERLDESSRMDAKNILEASV